MAQNWTPPPPVGSQPQPPVGSQPPPNYLVWGILATLFCCLPGGIISIIFATQVNSKYAAGDFAGAQDASKKAKLFVIISVGIGLLIWIVGLIYWIVMIGILASQSANR